MTFLPLFDLTDGKGFRTPSISMLGLELRPHHVRAALVARGEVVRRHERPLPAGPSPNVVLDAIVSAAQALEVTPKAAGLAIPGEVDGSGRCWGLPELPGFDGVLIAEELAARLGCPVSIESEGSSAALAERVHGRGRGHASLLSVLLGERLSAGLVIDGQLRRGRSGFGASIAHLKIDASGGARTCGCGRQGCLVTYAGPLADPAVSKLATSGDEIALATVQRVGVALGTALSLVQNMLDLDVISLVTPVPGLFALLEPQLRQALRAGVFGAAAGEVPVLESSLGGDAVLLGAAELAQRGVSEAG